MNNEYGLRCCLKCKERLPPWDFPRLEDITPIKELECKDCLSIKLKRHVKEINGENY